MPEDIPIRGDMIRLGQLLKLAGVVGAGGEVKALLTSVEVRVNGELEARRGRQLHPGDEVAAFSVTRRFLYAGFSRSSKDCGGSSFLSLISMKHSSVLFSTCGLSEQPELVPMRSPTCRSG